MSSSFDHPLHNMIAGLSVAGFFIGLNMAIAGLALLLIITVISYFAEEEFPRSRKVAAWLAFYGSILTAISFGTCAMSFFLPR